MMDPKQLADDLRWGAKTLRVVDRHQWEDRALRLEALAAAFDQAREGWMQAQPDRPGAYRSHISIRLWYTPNAQRVLVVPIPEEFSGENTEENP